MLQHTSTTAILTVFLLVVLHHQTAEAQCTSLSTASQQYTLSQDVVADGTVDSCIVITGNDVVLDCGGHSITCAWPCENAIVIAAPGVTVKNCVIQFNNTGIYVTPLSSPPPAPTSDTSSTLITNNQLSSIEANPTWENTTYGILLDTDFGTPININGNTLSNIRGGGNVYGLFAGSISTSLHIDGNTFSTISGGNPRAIYLHATSNSYITSNNMQTLYDTAVPFSCPLNTDVSMVQVDHSSGITIANNTINNVAGRTKGSVSCGGTGTSNFGNGILCTYSSSLIVQHNTISMIKGGSSEDTYIGGSAFGISLRPETSDDSLISDNTITQLSGGFGGTYLSVGLAGGDAVGISHSGTALASTQSPLIELNTINVLISGNGGSGSGDKGGNSGAVYGISAQYADVDTNTIKNLLGGSGGSATGASAGGSAQPTYAIYISAGAVAVANNNIDTLSGGSGGTSETGQAGSSGTVAAIALAETPSILFGNTISNIAGGGVTVQDLNQKLGGCSSTVLDSGGSNICYPPGGCCDSSCALLSGGTVCRPSTGGCDIEEVCSGTSPDCPVDEVLPAGSSCGTASENSTAGVCSAPGGGMCDGVSASCPSGFADNTTVCRPAVGSCDISEYCTGTSADCPPDILKPANTSCRAATSVCDIAEVCNGVDGICPDDQIQPAGFVCRTAVGLCDLDALCSGNDTVCPAQAFKGPDAICREAVGDCDVTEYCTGDSSNCPDDVIQPIGYVCRESVGECDVAEMCTGNSSYCPDDTFAAEGAVCRPSAGACDAPEYCSGNSPTCPDDVIYPSDYVCRPSAGPCDVPELCPGPGAENATECPADVYLSQGTICRSANGTCDVEETCSGDSPFCPDDVIYGADVMCRNATGSCDVPEYCTGDSTSCPDDEFLAADTMCRPAAGLCDIAEYCTGLDPNCPDDVIISGPLSGDQSTTNNTNDSSSYHICRNSTTFCDPAEICDGLHAVCPDDVNNCNLYPLALQVTLTYNSGGLVSIIGRNFGVIASDLNVTIGNFACTRVKVIVNNTVITCFMPPGSGHKLPVYVSRGNNLRPYVNATFSFKPFVMGNITVTSLENSSVLIYWNKPVGSLPTTYFVVRYTRNESAVGQFQRIYSNNSYVIITNLQPNTTYLFSVRAYLSFLQQSVNSTSPIKTAQVLPVITSSNNTNATPSSPPPKTGKCNLSVTPYQCANGICATQYSQCFYQICPLYTCWDGSCAKNYTKCPSLPTCPILTKRCPSSQCILGNNTCPTTNCTDDGKKLCPDGSCNFFCASYFGCPRSSPILCPNGDCVANLSHCAKNCSGVHFENNVTTISTVFQCYDGKCVNDSSLCATAPRLILPAPVHVKLQAVNQGSNNTSHTNYTVPIYAEDSDTSLVVIELSSSAFDDATTNNPDFWNETSSSSSSSSSSDDSDSGDDFELIARPVADSDLQDVAGFSSWSNMSFHSNTFSSVISLSIGGASSFKFSTKVLISFVATLPPEVNISTLCLGFVNESSNSWNCESDIFITNSGLLAGYTTHFTDFAVIMGPVQAPQVTPLRPSSVLLLGSIDHNVTAVYVISGIFFLYTAGVILAFFIDTRHHKKIREQADDEAKRHIHQHSSKYDDNKIYSENDKSGIIALDELRVSVEQPRDFKGKSALMTATETPPSSPLPTPAASSATISTTATATATTATTTTTKHDLDDNDPKRLMHRASYSEKVGVLMLHRLREKHSWLAVIFRSNTTSLTRIDRITILLCMIMSNMVASAAFYDSREAGGLAQHIVIGLIVGSIVFPTTLLTTFVFGRATQRKYKLLCYAIAVLFCLGCGTVTIMYTLEFGHEKANAWLISMGTSTAQDGFLNQPIKLLVSAAIVACCPFSWLANII